jgi:hypothetical protein
MRVFSEKSFQNFKVFFQNQNAIQRGVCVCVSGDSGLNLLVFQTIASEVTRDTE